MVKRDKKRTIRYTPSLGRVIARAAKRSRTGRFHVIPSISDEGKWSLVSEGSTSPVRIFTTKDAAVGFVKKSSFGKMGFVVIHNKDGQVQNTISFQTKD